MPVAGDYIVAANVCACHADGLPHSSGQHQTRGVDPDDRAVGHRPGFQFQYGACHHPVFRRSAGNRGHRLLDHGQADQGDVAEVRPDRSGGGADPAGLPAPPVAVDRTALGEARAASFGIPVRRLRLETLILVSLLSASPVAFVGTIGFVGLVGPHIARMMVGEDQRFLLPASALTGALIMSLSSVLAKIAVRGAVLPIGIVTAAIGLPVFLYLILKSGREIW